jgi:protocatechuate 3,4-dioxygenase beta subunit
MLVAALVAVLGVVVYLWVGRDQADPSPDAAAPSVEDHEKMPGPAGGLRAGSTPSSPQEARGIVRGRVEGVDGVPVAGAVVTLTPADDDASDEPRSVRSNAEGRFELDDLPARRYAISATAAGHLPAVQRNLDVRAETSITLTLAPGGHPLRGTVSDATGGAVEGALVRLTPVSGVIDLRRLDGFGTLSDEDGAYAVHVAPGRYRVDVSHPDYATDTRTVEVGPGAQSQDFALIPMGVIEGVVREREGARAVPGAWVSWERERQKTIVPGHRVATVEGSGVVQADEQGRFVVRGLSPGAIGLRARAAGRVSEVATVVPLAMAEHVTQVVVPVVAAHDLRGRVVAAGDPEHGISGASVNLVPDERAGPRATADEEGRFVLTGVLAGSYHQRRGRRGCHRVGRHRAGASTHDPRAGRARHGGRGVHRAARTEHAHGHGPGRRDAAARRRGPDRDR